MEKTQEKIQLLLRIVHRLNEAGVEWALGASMLLYFKGITSDFHDIDLMVTDCDAECVRTILSEMGESFPSASIPNPMYRAKTFMEFFIDSVEVDVMAGFAIVYAKSKSWRKCRWKQKLSRYNHRRYGANTISADGKG